MHKITAPLPAQMSPVAEAVWFCTATDFFLPKFIPSQKQAPFYLSIPGFRLPEAADASALVPGYFPNQPVHQQ